MRQRVQCIRCFNLRVGTLVARSWQYRQSRVIEVEHQRLGRPYK